MDPIINKKIKKHKTNNYILRLFGSMSYVLFKITKIKLFKKYVDKWASYYENALSDEDQEKIRYWAKTLHHKVWAHDNEWKDYDDKGNPVWYKKN